MKVICRSGHFAFYPQSRTELLRFVRLFKLPLYQERDYFTFEALLDLPRWSQVGRPFGNIVAVETYEGQFPWEPMRENSFVYSLGTELLVPALLITEVLSLPQTLDCAVAPKPLLQPGAKLSTGEVLMGYEGNLDLEIKRLYIYSRETLL